jgi:hypothetical protein
MSNDSTLCGSIKVFTKLLGLQYKIVYKKGTENRVANALSKRVHEVNELSAIS